MILETIVDLYDLAEHLMMKVPFNDFLVSMVTDAKVFRAAKLQYTATMTDTEIVFEKIA